MDDVNELVLEDDEQPATNRFLDLRQSLRVLTQNRVRNFSTAPNTVGETVYGSLNSAGNFGGLGNRKDTQKNTAGANGNFREGNFREGNFREGNFREGNFKEGNNREGNNREGNFKEGISKEGNFRDGNIRDGNFREGNFREGNARAGNLRDGNIRDGNISRAGNIREGIFRDGIFKEGNNREGNNRDGNFKEGNFRDGNFSREGNFREGNLRDGNIRDGIFKEGNIRNGNISREGNFREGNWRNLNPIDNRNIVRVDGGCGNLNSSAEGSDRGGQNAAKNTEKKNVSKVLLPGPAGRLQSTRRENGNFSLTENNPNKIKIKNKNWAAENFGRGGFDPDFISKEWENGVKALENNEFQAGSPLLVPHTIDRILSGELKGKLPQILVFVSSLHSNGEFSAYAKLKDQTGEIGGIIHRTTFLQHSNIRAKSVVLLEQVPIFSPCPDQHYFCIMPKNIKKVWQWTAASPGPKSTENRSMLSGSQSPLNVGQNSQQRDDQLHANVTLQPHFQPQQRSPPLPRFACQTREGRTEYSQQRSGNLSNAQDSEDELELDLEVGDDDFAGGMAKVVRPPPPFQSRDTGNQSGMRECSSNGARQQGIHVNREYSQSLHGDSGVRNRSTAHCGSKRGVLDLFHEVREPKGGVSGNRVESSTQYHQSSQISGHPPPARKRRAPPAYEAKDVTLDDAFAAPKTGDKSIVNLLKRMGARPIGKRN